MIQLTEMQQEAVKGKSHHMLIKGIPGSGKTLVLQEKVKHILDQKPDATILIVTYNNTLKNYMEASLKRDGVKTVSIMTYHSWAIAALKKVIPNFSMNTNPNLIKKVYEQVEKEIERKYPTHSFWDKKMKGFLQEEHEWILGKGIESKEEYLEVSRTGRGTALQKNDRKIVAEFVERVEELVIVKGYLPFSAYADYVNRHIDKIREVYQYDAIFIDEAQDLTQLQLITLRKLAENAQLIVAADLGQKIYKTDFTWRSVGINILGGRTKNLNIPHRSTAETMELALSLLKNDPLIKEEEDLVSTEQMRVTGEKPVVVEAKGKSIEAVASTIKKIWSKEGKELTIGILVPTNKSLYYYDNNLTRYGVSCEKIDRKSGDVLKPGVKVVTMHGAKGLEFDVVIVTELNKRFPMMWGVVEGEEENRVETDRRLLYVSMTRARGRLYLVYDREPSRYIEELDKALYEYIEM